MNHDDERDFEEEAANAALMRDEYGPTCSHGLPLEDNMHLEAQTVGGGENLQHVARWEPCSDKSLSLSSQELRHIVRCLEYRAKMGGWSIADGKDGTIARHRHLVALITDEADRRQL